ncbi:MAG: OmpA family protein [Bacteroidales bacterium]|nr:OmpA family protein [Bacteroidales bacterium]
MNRRTFFLALGLWCGMMHLAQAQNVACTPDPAALKRAEVNYQRALAAYQNGLSNQAWKFIRIAQNIEPCYADLHLLKATIWEDEKKLDSAISAYKKALSINPDVYPNGWFFLAQLEMNTGRYDEADTHFSRFLTYSSISAKMREKAEMMRLRNRETLETVRHSVPFSPVNLGPNINTPYDEYMPLVTVDDSMLIFTRRYMKEYSDTKLRKLEEDFFMSKRDSTGAWTLAVPLPGEVNSDDNEGTQSISPDGRYLFFAGCGRPDGRGSCDIYVSRRTKDGWGRPFNIGEPVNTTAWESQPCMSSDGKTLYFTSTRAGGHGGSDLWKAELTDIGTWRTPVNLGDVINTPGDESSPFLHPDGKTLYFASNGHGGLGGVDLWVSRMDEQGRWSVPQNLGYPINTHEDEFALYVNARGDTAYYSRTGEDGYGKADIYAFPLYEQARPATVSFMRGNVYDEETGKPLAAKFELISLKTKQVRIASQADARDGGFFVCLPCDEAFALNVSCPGYLFYSEHIALDGKHINTPLQKGIALKPIRKNAAIVLNNIFYKTNQYTLEESSLAELGRIFTFLAQNPTVKVEIGGHTDDIGSESYNKTLSQKRAQAVADYLISQGIDPARLSAVGYGMEKPAVPNDSDENRALNRRTEMKIL